MTNVTFEGMGLSPEVLKAVGVLGFEAPSPIQAAAIPVLMTGRDVVGQSQTGSGKTAAFGIPAIEKIDASDLSVQVLILCPTRELATQVANEMHKLTAFKKGIHSVPIYGGASYERQFFELKKGVQIVIGTPGRVIDHLERGTLTLGSLRMAVLDEADRMLDMGFREDIEKILAAMPESRQTVFFSATVSKAIRELINRYSRDPATVRIEQKEVSAPDIEQWFYETHSRAKLDALTRLIDYHGFKLGLIFCNTQRMVDDLADSLAALGFSTDRLHGGIAQAQRTRVMNKFKKAEFEFLVATDVAARGIDVDDLEFVVNYDLPYDAEDYVHRIGRTGRAGKRGVAATFVSGREIYKLQFIERFTKTKIRRGKLPTDSEVEERRTDVMLDKVRGLLDSGAWKAYAPTVERLLEEGMSSTELAAAALSALAGPPPEPPKKEKIPQPDHFERDNRKSGKRSDWDSGDSRQSRNELGNPAPGKAWIEVGVGRSEGYGPREIVDLLSTSGGLLGKQVGSIVLGADTSHVQVPEGFVGALPSGGMTLEREGGTISLTKATIAPSEGSRGPKRHHSKFSPGEFPKKKFKKAFNKGFKKSHSKGAGSRRK